MEAGAVGERKEEGEENEEGEFLSRLLSAMTEGPSKKLHLLEVCSPSQDHRS